MVLNNIYKTIISRRTIRKFKPKKIVKNILKKLVNAGRLAPSAANLQPLEYFVVSDNDLKKKIFSTITWAKYIEPKGNPGEGEEPAAYIIILINKKINQNPHEDIGASAENINLAALGEGIACCWIGNFNKRVLIDILQLPDDFIPSLVLALGYPLEKPVIEDIKKNSSIRYYKDSSGKLHVPKRRLEDIIHINLF
jgi:nitroreductase